MTTNPKVTLHTSMGEIELELNTQEAPLSVKNFLSYVEEGFYDGTVFHRIIKNFMIQGGGMVLDGKELEQKETKAPISNEASNGLKNNRGTIAMARTSDPNSATSQFFINVVDNPFLNYPGQDGHGYCVFGKVTAGMEVVDQIKAVQTKAGDVPLTPVVIESATLLNPTQ